MRAIIIEEARFSEVCALMEKAVTDSAKYSQHRPMGLNQEDWEVALKSAHRSIHCSVSDRPWLLSEEERADMDRLCRLAFEVWR
jgi:hypothetical protein